MLNKKKFSKSFIAIFIFFLLLAIVVVFESPLFLNEKNKSQINSGPKKSELFFHSLNEYSSYYGFKITLPQDWFFDAEIARSDNEVSPYYSLRKGKYMMKNEIPKRIYLSVQNDDKPDEPLNKIFKSELIEGKSQTEKALTVNGLEVFLRSRIYGGVFVGDSDYTEHSLYIRLEKYLLNLNFREEKGQEENMKVFEKVYNSVTAL